MLSHYHYSESEQKQLLKSITVLADTRENQNQHIVSWLTKKSIPCQSMKLGSGDYSFMVPANSELGIYRDMYFDNEIWVERKASLDELSNNLSHERQRFEDEMLRAGTCQKYLLIESGSLNDIINGHYKTELSPSSYFASVLTFSQRYGLETIFASPEHSGQVIYGLFYYHLRELLK